MQTLGDILAATIGGLKTERTMHPKSKTASNGMLWVRVQSAYHEQLIVILLES